MLFAKSLSVQTMNINIVVVEKYLSISELIIFSYIFKILG